MLRNELNYAFLGVLISAFCISAGHAELTELEELPVLNAASLSSESEVSTWKKIGKKTRIGSFTEFMTPAIENNANYIPYEDGSKLLPSNAFNIIWFDYDIGNDYKVLYFQRSNFNVATSSMGENISLVPRNPRFALRKLNVFNNKNLTTQYDFYIQPGLAHEASAAGRDLELGFRTSTSYAIPGSRWTVGALTEFTTAFSFRGRAPEGSSSVYGWAVPWVWYNLNKTFSTIHYVTVAFQHVRYTTGIQSDYPMPFNTQNGIGINVSEKVWAAVLLNNYLNTKPTLSNTWASLWLNLVLW